MSVTDGIMLHNFTLPAVSGTWMYSPGRDVDPGWTAAYTGTPDIVDSTNREGQGYMYYQTQTANGTKVALDFIGTRVHLCIRSDDAKYQFTVDGTIFELPVTGRFNDPQCIALGAPTTLSSDLLPQGAHRAELTVLEASPSSEFRFFGGVAVSELVVDVEPSEVLATYNVDDLDAKWASITQVWTTKWITTADEPLAYEKTTTVNCNYGIDQTNSIDITGASAALLYGFLNEESHYYSVELDGTVFNGDASTSMWRAGSAPIFMRAGLDPSKNYTLTYRNYNENFPECGTHSNGLARRCCGSIDRLQLFGSPATVKAQTGSPSTAVSTTASRSDEPTTSSTVVPANLGPSSSSSPVAAIIAGVLGGLLFVCIIALLLCWRWHGTKRRRVPELGRSSTLASEDTAREDAVEPWLESLQDYITAYRVSTAMNQVSSTGEKDWTTKPLPALPRGTSPSTSASDSIAPLTPAPAPGAPLRPVDMRLILAYVAARMDPPRAPGGESSAVPPSYQ